MAWISLSMLMIFVFGLTYLIACHVGNIKDSAYKELWTPWLVMAIFFAFSLSILWTSVELRVALAALVKHGKLLEIVILISLIRTSQEARIAVTAFAAGQALLLLTSWLMAAGVHIPWAKITQFKYVVFSTYLDQSIIFATSSAIFWHLRSDDLWPRWIATLLAAAALINVLLLLEGRTGYAVALTVLTLSVMWAMPKRLHLISIIVTPLVVLVSLYLGSAQVHNRLSEIIHETQNYATQDVSESSSGWRLNAWHRSLQAIKEKPWLGHGIGSWTMKVKGLEGEAATHVFGKGSASNPHQEYLLWGVELGIGGSLLLFGLAAAIVRDAFRFKKSTKRALISVVIAMAVACMFNSTLYDSLIGHYFCIAIGLLIALGVRSAPPFSAQTLSTRDLQKLKVAT